MTNIQPVDVKSTEGATADILDVVKSKMGMVPNILATMAQSPSVAKAYLEFSGALGGGSLSPRIREQLALAVGEENSCHYCVSAHSVLGKSAGLNDDDIINARKCKATDGKENAVLEFAQRAVRNRGQVSSSDVSGLRQAGFSDGEICEIVGNIALNIFSNYFNEIAGTEIDFPVAPKITA